jgi:hypothetical protein
MSIVYFAKILSYIKYKIVSNFEILVLVESVLDWDWYDGCFVSFATALGIKLWIEVITPVTEIPKCRWKSQINHCPDYLLLIFVTLGHT